MNPFVLLFGFSGRINRAKFWLAALIYCVFFFAVIGIAMALSSSMNAVFGAAIVAYMPLIVSGLAVGIKRLHDRDKSGWWLVLFYLLPSLLFGAGAGLFIYGIGEEAASGVIGGGVLYVLGLAALIWAIVELGCLRGTLGPNQFGPDPLTAS